MSKKELFGFDIEYPGVLTNKSWQKKKSLKDKAMSKTKTGLGDLLVRAEKSWGKLDFKALHPKMSTDINLLSDSAALAESKKAAIAQKGDLAAVSKDLTAVGYKAKQIVKAGTISKDAAAAAAEIERTAYNLEAQVSKFSIEKAYDDAIKEAEAQLKKVKTDYSTAAKQLDMLVGKIISDPSEKNYFLFTNNADKRLGKMQSATSTFTRMSGPQQNDWKKAVVAIKEIEKLIPQFNKTMKDPKTPDEMKQKVVALFAVKCAHQMKVLLKLA